MGPVWNLAPEDPKLAAALAGRLQVSPLVAQLLINRGYADVDAAKVFLEPRVDQLHDPGTLLGIDAAVERVARHIEAGDKVCVYGDFDVDGVTSTALLSEVLTALGARVFAFIPDRFRHGYGLHADVVRQLAAKDYRLLITVDNGITSVDEVALARELGLTVIVTDHHEPRGTPPEADAVVNPRQPECAYPFKDLAGVGVAFKLADSLVRRLDRGDLALDYLDLVALGSVADLVPLVGENRVLVSLGLAQLRRSKRVGVRKLAEVSALDLAQVTAGQIAFILAPRINAGGRISSARECLRLLVTTDRSEALAAARSLDRRNRERQQLEDAMFKQASTLVEQTDWRSRRSIVLASADWHEGVKGIVASRLVDRFHRPAILFSVHDGVYKGSGRSIKALDMFAALKQCEDLVIRWGGHRAAAGITLAEACYEAFSERFESLVAGLLTDQDLLGSVDIDATLPLDAVSHDLVEEVEGLGPFGMGNPTPVFTAAGVYLEGQAPVGAGHLRFVAHGGGGAVEAMAFRVANLAELVNYRGPAGIAFNLNRRRWNGSERIQLRAIDVKPIRPRKRAALSDVQATVEALLETASPAIDAPAALDGDVTTPAPNGRLQLVDKRDIDDKDGYVLERLHQAGLIVFMNTEARALELARRWRECSGETVAYLGPSVGRELTVKAQRLFASGKLRALAVCGSRPPGGRQVIFYDPPLTPAQFVGVTDGVSLAHLIYSKDDIEAAEQLVAALAPDRTALGGAYRELRAGNEAQVGGAHSALFGRIVALIFGELGLFADGGLRDGGDRVNLHDSPTFAAGVRLRAVFDRLKPALLGRPAALAKAAAEG